MSSPDTPFVYVYDYDTPPSDAVDLVIGYVDHAGECKVMVPDPGPDGTMRPSTVPLNGVVPISMRLSIDAALTLYSDLHDAFYKLGVNSPQKPAHTEDTSVHVASQTYPCAPIAELGRVCVIDGAQQVHTYTHAALFKFTDATHLRNAINARLVAVDGFFPEPKP